MKKILIAGIIGATVNAGYTPTNVNGATTTEQSQTITQAQTEWKGLKTNDKAAVETNTVKIWTTTTKMQG